LIANEREQKGNGNELSRNGTSRSRRDPLCGAPCSKIERTRNQSWGSWL